MTTDSKLDWYKHRLSVMPPAEVAHRVVHAAQGRMLQMLGTPHKLRHVPKPPRDPIALHFSDADLAPLKLTLPCEEIARRALSTEHQHRFSFLHAPERDFQTPVEWHLDPLTGEHWDPKAIAFGAEVKRQAALGEVKFIWELGRMPWLVQRAVAARVLGNERVARGILDDIESFVAANPPYHGVHWTSGIEMAFRIASWTWSLALIAPLISPDAEWWRRMGLHVALQADYCSRFLSLYSSANNHLVAEAAGMEIAALAWPWLPGSNDRGLVGSQLMDRELQRQILPDGTSAEGSVFYLLEVLEWSLAVARLRAEHGRPIPAVWGERWNASANMLLDLCREREEPPQVSDNDEAHILPIFTGRDSAAREIARTICSLGSTVDAASTALLAVVNHAAMPRPTCSTPKAGMSPQITVFQDGGLVVLRAGRVRMTMDAGPHGLAPLYAHAHADALSITLDVRGRPVLLDPGTFCYHGRPELRNWFRSTRAHNTVEIDGRNQSEMRGPFLWHRVANTRILETQQSPKAICVAEHDGYAPIIHRREVRMSTFAGIEFHIIDTIVPQSGQADSKHHDVALWWHLGPGELQRGSHHVAWTSGSMVLELEWKAAQEAETHVYNGGDEPEGWFSPAFGQREAAPTVCVKFAAKLPFSCVTVLRLQTR